MEGSSPGTEFYPSGTWGNPNMEHPIEIKSKLKATDVAETSGTFETHSRILTLW
jgi:hypothetical protein